MCIFVWFVVLRGLRHATRAVQSTVATSHLRTTVSLLPHANSKPTEENEDEDDSGEGEEEGICLC